MRIRCICFLNMQRHVHNHSPCLFCQYLQTEVKGVTNAHTPNILNQMIYTRAGNLQVSTDYESTNQREINLNRKVHINLNNTAPTIILRVCFVNIYKRK
jgi:hypothetical protein